MMDLQLDRVIAHRGASAYAPENTLAAFRQAKALGARWVEFDVMLAADKEAVVIHDDTLNRTTDGSGPVPNLSYPELAKLDAGSWFDERFQGERIPTLKAVFDCLAECQLAANIEIKPYPGAEIETVETVVAMIQQDWPTQLPPPLVSSFSHTCLEQARALDSSLILGLLLHHWRDDWQDLADGIDSATVHLNKSIVTADRVAQIKQTDRFVLGYTANTVKQAERLYAMGIDAVFSDYPDVILSIAS